MPKLSSYRKHMNSEEERLTLLFTAISDSEHPLCDVILQVPDSDDAWVSIASNSVFLRAKSAVFDAMWQSDGSDKGKHTIDIADCSVEAIQALNAVAFGQWDAVVVTAQNVAELLYAALKYDFKLVVDCCQQFVDDMLAKNDVGTWLPLVSALYKGKLTDYATKVAAKGEMFSAKLTNAFECEAATGLPLSLFRDLLKEDSLSLSEEVIWKQCVRWAKENCEEPSEVSGITDAEIHDFRRDPMFRISIPGDNSEEELKDESLEETIAEPFVVAMRPLKEHIRFPLMTLEFLITEVAATSLLTHSEIVCMCQASLGVAANDSHFCSAKKRMRRREDAWKKFVKSKSVEKRVVPKPMQCADEGTDDEYYSDSGYGETPTPQPANRSFWPDNY